MIIEGGALNWPKYGLWAGTIFFSLLFVASAFSPIIHKLKVIFFQVRQFYAAAVIAETT